jgi:hypothetical protein
MKVSVYYTDKKGDTFLPATRKSNDDVTDLCAGYLNNYPRGTHECWYFLVPFNIPQPLPYARFALRYRVDISPGIAYRTYTKAMLDLVSPHDVHYITVDNRFDMDRSNIDIDRAVFVHGGIQHNVKEQNVEHTTNILQLLFTDLERSENKDRIILVLGAVPGTGITLLTDWLIALIDVVTRSKSS